jgi:hypothetical protein
VTRGRIPSATRGVRALCSVVVLCWTALLVARSSTPSLRDAQPSLRVVAAAESAAFVASVPVRHVATADAPRWRAPWPVVPVVPSTQLSGVPRTDASSATSGLLCARTGGRILHGYDAAAPPALV